MAKVTFHERFDYRPNRSTWITYDAGRTYDNVPRKAADEAVALGKAKEDKAPRRRPTYATGGVVRRGKPHVVGE